jgi:methionyl-tRNA synthetase
MSKIFVGVAWPYANGVIHLGHLAGSLLPPDIFSRYRRLQGDTVLMVSGSDQHGTPITVTAEKEGKRPEEVADRFHQLNKKAIEDMGIEFSLFTKTHHENHQKVVQDIFLALRDKDLLYTDKTLQYYCSSCHRFLPDRYVHGVCPKCGAPDTRGDQCDDCGMTFEAGDLLECHCSHCGDEPEIRETDHFFLRLSSFQERLLQYLEEKEDWRSNVKAFTRNWLEGGLNDRAITRDMDWGVPVPVEGWEEKVIYVWFEAVIGYLSASKEYSQLQGDPDLWRDYWQDPQVKHYYFLGKDNIPFHSIIWPAILMGLGGLNLPDEIPANEYLTFKGGKLSKSRGTSIDIPSVLSRFAPDLVRYYLAVNMPDHRDAEFSWEDFQAKVNNELVSTLGNYYHRVLSFTRKNYSSIPPLQDASRLKEVRAEIERVRAEVEDHMESFDFKKALRSIMELSGYGNRYFDSVKPWSLVKSDRDGCGDVLHCNLEIVKALAIMSWPFLPFSAQEVWGYMGLKNGPLQAGWSGIDVPLPAGQELTDPVPVFKKVEIEKEEEEPVPAPQPVKEPEASPFSDLSQLDLRAGTVLSAEDHPDAEKLFVLKVSMGEERQIVAGLRAYYSREEMLGRKVVVVSNLKPAKLRGIRSEGMLLAADDESLGGSTVLLLRPSKDVPDGTRIDSGLTVRESRIEYKDFQKAVMRVARHEDGAMLLDGSPAVELDEAAPEYLAVALEDGRALPLRSADGAYLTVERPISDGACIR